MNLNPNLKGLLLSSTASGGLIASVAFGATVSPFFLFTTPILALSLVCMLLTGKPNSDGVCLGAAAGLSIMAGCCTAIGAGFLPMPFDNKPSDAQTLIITADYPTPK